MLGVLRGSAPTPASFRCFAGLRPNPRKFFEKNLTKNFTEGKVLAHIAHSTVVLA